MAHPRASVCVLTRCVIASHCSGASLPGQVASESPSRSAGAGTHQELMPAPHCAAEAERTVRVRRHRKEHGQAETRDDKRDERDRTQAFAGNASRSSAWAQPKIWPGTAGLNPG